MDIKAFFASVIPWDEDGYCSIHTKAPGKSRGDFSGENFRDLDPFLERVADWQRSTAKLEIYFALGRHRGRRTGDSSFAFRALRADLDVDPNNPDKYPDVQTAIAAVFDFCKTNSLPRPSAVVVSGGGIHVYWFSDRTLLINDWMPYAKGLKQLLKNEQIKNDLQVVADPARVLRIPGTRNHKEDPPRKVWLFDQFSPGTQYDFSKYFASLLTVAPIGKLGRKLGKPADKAFKGIDRDDDDPAGGTEREAPTPILERVLAGCPWLQEVHDKHGAGQSEPLWRHSLRCAVFFDEAEKLKVDFSDQHKGYDPDELAEKWEHVLQDKDTYGWPKCATIQNDGCKHCATCPHLKAGKSPLNLGLPTRAERIAEELEELGGELPEELDLPEGFCRDTETGFICAIVQNKKGVSRLLPIIKTKIWDPAIEWRDNAYGLAFYAVTEKDTEARIFVSNTDVYNGKAPSKWSAQLVMVTPNKQERALAEVFAATWVDRLRSYTQVSKNMDTLGWRFHDGQRTGFVYGNHFYKPNEAIVLPDMGNDEFRQWYQPTGKAEPWIDAMRLITGRKRPELDILVSVGFAAPLMTFTGNVYGGILSVYGEPGTMKSCGQQAAAAVWGHPKLTRESLNSTPKSVQNRLGRIQNLAAYWDDIQSQDQQGFLNNTMFVATQGAEGSRLNADATQKERKQWHTLLVACSNVSFVEYLQATEKNTTAGLRRVLEFRFDKGPSDITGFVDPFEANRVFSALEFNYGRIGQHYAKYMADHRERVEDIVTATVQGFRRHVEGRPEENYWWSMCGVLLAGASLAKKVGGEMDVAAMHTFLAKVFRENRAIRDGGTEAGSKLATENVISEFLNDHAGKGALVYTDISYRNHRVQVDLIKATESRAVTAAHMIRDERKIAIRKSVLQEYLFGKNISGQGVINGMKKHFFVEEKRHTVAFGTAEQLSAEPCYILPVPVGSRFEPLLTAFGPVKANMKLVR